MQVHCQAQANFYPGCHACTVPEYNIPGIIYTTGGPLGNMTLKKKGGNWVKGNDKKGGHSGLEKSKKGGH